MWIGTDSPDLHNDLAGALNNLGHLVSHRTVANLLKRHGIEPAPERGKCMIWRDFIRSHLEVLVLGGKRPGSH
jgi:hypothetical protein